MSLLLTTNLISIKARAVKSLQSAEHISYVCVFFFLHTSPIRAAMPVDRLSLLILRRSFTASLESPSGLPALPGSVSADQDLLIKGMLSN